MGAPEEEDERRRKRRMALADAGSEKPLDIELPFEGSKAQRDVLANADEAIAERDAKPAKATEIAKPMMPLKKRKTGYVLTAGDAAQALKERMGDR